MICGETPATLRVYEENGKQKYRVTLDPHLEFDKTQHRREGQFKCGRYWYSPSTLERIAGKGLCKKWKRSVRMIKVGRLLCLQGARLASTRNRTCNSTRIPRACVALQEGGGGGEMVEKWLERLPGSSSERSKLRPPAAQDEALQVALT